MAKNFIINVGLKALDHLSPSLKKAIARVNEMKKQANKLTQEQKNHNRLLEEYRKTLNPLNDKLKSTQEALGRERQELNRLRQAMQMTKQPTNELRKSLANAEKTVKKLEHSQSKIVAKIESARSEFKRAGFNTQEWNKKQQELAQRTKQANRELEIQRATLARLNAQHARRAKIKEAVNKVRSVGQRALITGGGVLYSLSRSLNSGIDFERAMAKVGSLTRLDKESKQLKELAEQAKQLGASTEFTATQVADAQGYLAIAGFTPENIKAAVPSVLNTALASGVDLALTSDILSDIAGGFKIPASQIGVVADVLTHTLTTSNTTLETLYETMKEGAPIMTALGQSMQSTAAMAGMLGNIGIKGSAAGTTLKNIGLNLVNNKHLEELEIEVKDENGNMRAIPEILADIKRKTDHMGSGDRSEVINKIFGKIPVAGALELISQADTHLIESIKKMENAKGASERVAKAMSDNLAGDIKSLGSAIEGLTISIYELVKEPLRHLVTGFTEVTRWVNEFTHKHPEIAKWGALVGGGLAGVITLLGILALAFSYVIYPITAFTIALLANPLTWFVVGITAIVGALYTLIFHFDWISDVVLRAKNYLNQWSFAGVGLGDAISWITKSLQLLATIIHTIGKGIYDAIFDIDSFKKTLSSGFDAIIAPFTYVVAMMGQVKESLNQFKILGFGLGDIFATPFDAMAKAINMVMHPIQTLRNMVDAIFATFNKVTDAIANLSFTKIGEMAGNVAGNITGGMADGIKSAASWLKNLAGFSSGGYVGTGGKYEPKGIVHGGEYVMTKEATQRIGIDTLNRLNYGRSLSIGAMVSSATLASGFVVDNREPINRHHEPPPAQIVQNFNITINGAKENAHNIADQVAKEVARIIRTQQVQARSYMGDRD